MDEFVRGCSRLRGSAKAIDIAKVSYDSKMFRKRIIKFMVVVEERLEALMPVSTYELGSVGEDGCKKMR